jgi:hypothetical protein
MRWNHYFLAQDTELASFWRDRLGGGERHLLCVHALGFDPRMCDAVSLLAAAGGTGRRDVQLIEFDEGPDSPSHALKPLVEANRTKLAGIVQDKGSIRSKTLKVLDASGRRVESVNAARLFSSIAEFKGYDGCSLCCDARSLQCRSRGLPAVLLITSFMAFWMNYSQTGKCTSRCTKGRMVFWRSTNPS